MHMPPLSGKVVMMLMVVVVVKLHYRDVDDMGRVDWSRQQRTKMVNHSQNETLKRLPGGKTKPKMLCV